MKNAKYLLAALFFCGCSSIAFNKSPQAKYEEAASRTFEFPKTDVFNACVDSLKQGGWTVTSSDLASGGITGVRGPGPGPASRTAPAGQTARVSVVEVLPGKVEVKITAGLSEANAASASAAGAPTALNLPQVCEPFLNSVQQTLVKIRPAGTN
jgi:hypothetical protein